MMDTMSNQGDVSLAGELRAIGRRAREMWNLIPAVQRWALVAACGLMTLGGVANTAIALLVGQMVDTARALPQLHAHTGAQQSAPGLYGMVIVYLLAIAGTYLLREGVQIARRYLVERTTTQLESQLLVRLVSQLLMADLATLSHEKVGTLHGRILRNVNGSIKFLRVGFLDFLPVLISGGLALSAVVFKHPYLGLVMAGLIPVSMFVTTRQLLSQKDVRLELLHTREAMDGMIVEQLNGIDYIRTANKLDREVERISSAAHALSVKELRHYLVMSLYGAGKSLNEGLFHVLVLGQAVYLATIGSISFGDILTISMLFLNVLAPLNELHRMIDEGHESSLLVGELLKMLAEPRDRSLLTAPGSRPNLASDRLLTIEDLCVDYHSPTPDRKQALVGVSLAVRRGEMVGIAGRSGCGKTTLLRTLLRLIHPHDGYAAIDGVPLESISREHLAQLVGYVGQSPFLFAGTIAENIAYERDGASLDEISSAAKLACLDDEIRAMSAGYHTMLGEHGHNLSGGQRQRLALARALLKNPPILLLDEATSALDTVCERHIQQSLAEIRGKHTVIIVAHRLSTLQHTDRIFMLDQGQIVETGTYDELVALGGNFAQLVQCAAAPKSRLPHRARASSSEHPS